jgi:hypothetical protein
MPSSAHVAKANDRQRSHEAPHFESVIWSDLLQSPAEAWACHEEADMPKRRSSVAKKARVAARKGTKYTAALREERLRSSTQQRAHVQSLQPTAAFNFMNSPALQAVQSLADSLTQRWALWDI